MQIIGPCDRERNKLEQTLCIDMIEHSKASVVFHSIESVFLFHLLSISQGFFEAT